MMRTLMMKLVLMLTNRQLGWSVSRSLVIWVCTCIVGASIHYAVHYTVPLVEAVALSLLFSSPVLFLAVPSLYLLPSFSSIPGRVLFSIASIFAGCGLIMGVVSVFFHLHYQLVAEELFPFVPSAIACYFLVARKKIATRVA